MPPKLYLVRHGEAEHNIHNDTSIHDPCLTPDGIAQCFKLRQRLPQDARIDLVVSSPMKRTIQTAAFVFEKVLQQNNSPLLLCPEAQELSNLNCDVGSTQTELLDALPALLEKHSNVSIENIDFSLWEDSWLNKDEGYYSLETQALKKRAADLRAWLYHRPEKEIVLVTHGSFLSYITEDWSGFDPRTNTGVGFANCELQELSKMIEAIKRQVIARTTTGIRLGLLSPSVKIHERLPWRAAVGCGNHDERADDRGK